MADPRWRLLTDSEWTLYSSRSIPSATAILEQHHIPIVLSESNLGPHPWRAMLDALEQFPEPPLLILVSRLDDERLWSEALSLGVYDLLAKPFAANEVMRIMSLAWLHWQELRGAVTTGNQKARAASGY
ncbi:hypothetical protein [Paludibaculum fermentans]|uniref:hypothetical protein n=1 Tax=Paludibaculum fermentans TaxID=1473598 RepID=UPI003EBEBB87